MLRTFSKHKSWIEKVCADICRRKKQEKCFRHHFYLLLLNKLKSVEQLPLLLFVYFHLTLYVDYGRENSYFFFTKKA